MTTMKLSKNEIVTAITADPSYLAKCCSQRAAGPSQAGSYYNLLPEEIKAAVLGAEWTTYPHTSITAGCVGLVAFIPGFMGVYPIDTLEEDECQDMHLIDPKGVGKASLAAKLPKGRELQETSFTVLILGPKENGEEGLTLWTFHPGAPIRASEAVMDLPAGGRPTTREEALSLGLTYAKIIPG
jgi:hypothetical protein